MKEIIGHVSDTERVFAYRAMCFARNAAAPLPGMDPDEFMASANFATLTLTDNVMEGEQQAAAIREALATLPPDQAEVLRLAFFEDNSQSAIASALPSDVPLSLNICVVASGRDAR